MIEFLLSASTSYNSRSSFFLLLRYTDLYPRKFIHVLSRSEKPISEGGDLHPLYPKDIGFAYDSEAYIKNETALSGCDFLPPSLLEVFLRKPASSDESYGKLAIYCTPTVPGQCRLIGSNILINSLDKKKAKGLSIYSLKIPLFLKHVLGSLFLVNLKIRSE